VNLSVGSLKLKAKATLTTRNTFIPSRSPVLNDLGAIGDAIRTGESTYSGCYEDGDNSGTNLPCEIIKNNGGLTSFFSKAVIADRARAGKGDGQTLGTYVRKTDAVLTNTVLMLNVGRNF
jgi:hypothetical protein